MAVWEVMSVLDVGCGDDSPTTLETLPAEVLLHIRKSQQYVDTLFELSFSQSPILTCQSLMLSQAFHLAFMHLHATAISTGRVCALLRPRVSPTRSLVWV